MKPELKLFFDFEFTSLSPDAQPISLGISTNINYTEDVLPVIDELVSDSAKGQQKNQDHYQNKIPKREVSFYAEFSDFYIERCDEWVKENVVGKLQMYHIQQPVDIYEPYSNSVKILTTLNGVKQALSHWIYQFSDHNIQFVCDCGTFDWYWMMQLLAEWNKTENSDGWNGNCPTCGTKGYPNFEIGLPKLPKNISPVPQDLNDLIAFKKGISAREAFDLNREELVGSWDNLEEIGQTGKVYNLDQFPKHNSLFDAKVIKAIYEKLSSKS